MEHIWKHVSNEQNQSQNQNEEESIWKWIGLTEEVFTIYQMLTTQPPTSRLKDSYDEDIDYIVVIFEP
jgi:hypothetical protein